MPKIGVLVGKASLKAVDSNGNCFAVGTGEKSVLVFGCLKFGSCRCIISHTVDGLAISLGSSSRRLSRVIMANVSRRGEIGSISTMSSLSIAGGLSAGPVASLSRSLRNKVAKLGIARDSNLPKTSTTTVGVHNVSALNADSPLILMSNVPVSVGRLSPGAVRDIAILGSTTTSTVCNTHTTGNIVIIGAGHKAPNGVDVSCGNCTNFRRTACLPRFIGTTSCVRVMGITGTGMKKTPVCSRRTVSTAEDRSSLVGCPSAS